MLDDLVSSPAQGRLTVSVSIAQPRPAETRPRRRISTMRAALLIMLLGAGTVLRTVSLYQSPAPSFRESALVTQVVQLSRLGVLGTTELGRLPVKLISLAGPQLAAISAGSGAWGRAPTALGAVRESGVALWLGVALLALLLARRLGAGRGWAVLAVALLALSPAAIASSRIAAPENVAAFWAMAALVVAVGGPGRDDPRWGEAGEMPGRRALCTDLAATAFLSIAVLSAPVAVALLPTVLMSTARRGDARRVALVGGSVLFATGLGAAALMAGAAPADLAACVPALHSGWFSGGPMGGDLLAAGLWLACVLLGLRSGRTRPVALGALLVPPLAVLFGSPAAGLTLPLVGVLLAVSAPGWLGRLPAPTRLPALVVTFAAGWALNYAALPAALTPPPTAQAMSWLRGHPPADQHVLTDRRTRVALVAGTDTWNQVSTVEDCRLRDVLMHNTRSAHCDRATLWIVDPSVSSGVPARSTLIAEFSSPNGGRHIQVRSTPPHHAPHPR